MMIFNVSQRGTLLVAVLALLASCAKTPQTPTEGVVAAQHGRVKMLSAVGFKTSLIEASPEGRLSIGRGKDYTPINADPTTLFAQLEGSMELRRKTAWSIVEALLEPQPLTVNGASFEVPLWHTWYEGMRGNPEVRQKINEFIAALAACKADSSCHKSREDIAKEVVATQGEKNLALSLTSTNLSQVLHQFQGPTNNRGETLGHGFTLFSPAFVEHLLAQAEQVEKCGRLQTAWDVPPLSVTQFSYCLPEFPRSAVMVKAQWMQIDPSKPQGVTNPTDANALSRMIQTGTWPKGQATTLLPGSAYTVQTTDGKTFALQSVHFSTKDTRQWIWISLWWSPDPNTDFGEDRPASIARFTGGIWANYKMCVVSSFTEADPTPWRSFEATNKLGLAASLKAAKEAISAQKGPAPYDKPTSWCSNQNIERQDGNGRTNCIGCHQYASSWNPATNAQTEFGETLVGDSAFPQFGRSQRRVNFPSDFSWSFTNEGLADAIESAREANHFTW
jgi:hypothetical protein